MGSIVKVMTVKMFLAFVTLISLSNSIDGSTFPENNSAFWFNPFTPFPEGTTPSRMDGSYSKVLKENVMASSKSSPLAAMPVEYSSFPSPQVFGRQPERREYNANKQSVISSQRPFQHLPQGQTTPQLQRPSKSQATLSEIYKFLPTPQDTLTNHHYSDLNGKRSKQPSYQQILEAVINQQRQHQDFLRNNLHRLSVQKQPALKQQRRPLRNYNQQRRLQYPSLGEQLFRPQYLQ